MVNNSYNPNIDYLKAVGIILMVLGHSGCSIPYIRQFIYMFHMPLFFIASGYCFKIAYLNNPKRFLIHRIKGLYWPFVKWGVIFLLLHNIFVSIGFFNDSSWNNYGDKFGLRDYASHFAGIVIFMRGQGELLGAYWFLKALLYGSIITWCILKTLKFIGVKQEKYRCLMGGVFLALMCVIINHLTLIIPYANISTNQFAAALFIIIGHGFASYKIKNFGIKSIILSFILTFAGSFFYYMEMGELCYDNKRFVPFIIISVIATWSLYSIIGKIKIKGCAAHILRYVGRNTLTILTWHFLSFKTISWIIIKVLGLSYSYMASFPVIAEYAAKGWWIAYFIFAIAICCCIAHLNKYINLYWLKL